MINLKEKQFLNSQTEPTKPTKEELTNQKLQLQIELLQQKKNQQAQKIQQQEQKKSKLEATRGVIKILMAICGILLAPFIILGGFLLACAKAAK
jgi:hypothetical protein